MSTEYDYEVVTISGEWGDGDGGLAWYRNTYANGGNTADVKHDEDVERFRGKKIRVVIWHSYGERNGLKICDIADVDEAAGIDSVARYEEGSQFDPSVKAPAPKVNRAYVYFTRVEPAAMLIGKEQLFPPYSNNSGDEQHDRKIVHFNHGTMPSDPAVRGWIEELLNPTDQGLVHPPEQTV